MPVASAVRSHDPCNDPTFNPLQSGDSRFAIYQEFQEKQLYLCTNMVVCMGQGSVSEHLWAIWKTESAERLRTTSQNGLEQTL